MDDYSDDTGPIVVAVVILLAGLLLSGGGCGCRLHVESRDSPPPVNG